MIECIILGDSIAVGTQMFYKECELYGKGGINTWQWNKMYPVLQNADVAVISLGTNDHARVKTRQELAATLGLNPAKRWLFFPENYRWAFHRAVDLEGMIASGLPLRHIGLYAYRTEFLLRFPELSPAPLESLESLEQLRALSRKDFDIDVDPERMRPSAVDISSVICDSSKLRAMTGWAPRIPAGLSWWKAKPSSPPGHRTW